MKRIKDIWNWIGKLDIRIVYAAFGILFLISVLASVLGIDLYWELLIGFSICIGLPVIYVVANSILNRDK